MTDTSGERARLGGSARAFPRVAARAAHLSGVLFVVVLLVGLIVRLLALRTSYAQQNSDTAIVYLMARHVLHGDWKVFYWGQFYGGTLLQLTAGAIFRLIGPSFTALQVIEIAYWLTACLLLRAAVANALGATAGNVAGALFWIGAPVMVHISFSDPGFYGDGLVIALCAVILAQGAPHRPRILRCLGMGLCLGLAFWTSPLALAVTLPAALWLFVRIRSVPSAIAVAGGTLVGSAPWLYETMKSHGQTLVRVHGNSGDASTRFLHVFTQVVPSAAGLAPGSAGAWLLAVTVLVLVVAGIVLAAWGRQLPVLVLAVSGLLVPAVIAASGEPVVASGTERYATYLVPALALLVAWGSSRAPAAGLALVVLALVWTTTTVWNASRGFEAVAHPAVGPDAHALGVRLERMHREFVWADYWIAYILSAATNERVVAADLSPRRTGPLTRLAEGAPRTTVVLYPGGPNEQILRSLPNLPPHTRTIVGPYVIWAFATRVDVGSHLLRGV